MGITYINRKKQTYFLHQGKTKLGNPRYFFSMKSEGNLAEGIPDGFEIYENPNAQVFLRKIPPKMITDEEVDIVKQGMENYSDIELFQIDVRKGALSIFTPIQNPSVLFEICSSTANIHGRSPQEIREFVEHSLSYADNLRFILVDKENRLFQTERYCYRGSIDDWIAIGSIGNLQDLVKTYVQHLEQDSFFDLI